MAGETGRQSSVTRVRKVPLNRPERRAEVLGAVLVLLAEVGYQRMTMDLVAGRARASKSTIYQRWPTKARLVVDAIEQHWDPPADPDTGDFVEDLRRLLGAWLGSWAALDHRVLIAVIEGGRGDAELARLRRERLRAPVNDAAERIVMRARERGELPADVDALLLVEMAFAKPLANLILDDPFPDSELIDRIMDNVLRPLLRDARSSIEPV